jgi:hypothetical protein
MITLKTVLVLGAGASHDYGPPLGAELLVQIDAACKNLVPGSPLHSALNSLPTDVMPRSDIHPLAERLVEASGRRSFPQ